MESFSALLAIQTAVIWDTITLIIAPLLGPVLTYFLKHSNEQYAMELNVYVFIVEML